MLIHTTHADVTTIQETKLASKAKTPKVHKFTTLRTDRFQKVGDGLNKPIRDNITFTTTDIPSTINTHNINLQIVRVHINNSDSLLMQPFIYLLETAYPCTTHQLTRIYNTAYNTSQTYHSQSSPEM